MEIGIKKENLSRISDILNIILANEVVLYTKTRNYHWNVTGPQFIELHNLYQQQYTQLEQVIDEIAERVRALDHFADGGLITFAKKSSIVDETSHPTASTQIFTLLADHESVIKLLRSYIHQVGETFKDLATADFLTGLMEQHEKTAWMLRAMSS